MVGRCDRPDLLVGVKMVLCHDDLPLQPREVLLPDGGTAPEQEAPLLPVQITEPDVPFQQRIRGNVHYPQIRVVGNLLRDPLEVQRNLSFSVQRRYALPPANIARMYL